MKTFLRKLGGGMAAAWWVVSLGACSTATEWLNEDPAAGAEKPAGPSAGEIIASLGSERTPQSAKPEPVPAADRPDGDDEPEKEAKTFADTWKGWFGGTEKDEASGTPEAAEQIGEPDQPEEAAPAGKPEPSGPEVDVSQLDLSGDFPTATKLKDREGYVLSPYDGRVINVKGIARGSLVADPRYPLEERKYFKVP